MNDGLEVFKEQVRLEHEERRDRQRREVEEHIADVIAARRRETEREAAIWRSRCAEDRERKRQALGHGALAEYRQRILTTVGILLTKVEMHLDTRFRALSDEERCQLAKALARESIESLEGPVIATVPAGCEGVVEDLPGVVRSEGLLEDPWGGCVIRDAETGRHVVDNTFRTRWHRSRGVLSLHLGVALASREEDVERFSRELRLS